jgi:hypothetical protein
MLRKRNLGKGCTIEIFPNKAKPIENPEEENSELKADKETLLRQISEQKNISLLNKFK